MVSVVTNKELDAIDAATEAENSLDLPDMAVSGISGYINKSWEAARTNKQTLVKDRILAAQRSRRGEYDPQKLAEIRSETGGSEEFGRVVSNKCRIAGSWLEDVYLGQTEKAWTLKATPVPSLTPDDMKEVETTIQKEIMEAVSVQGKAPPTGMVQQRKNELIDAVRMRMKEQAKLSVERMEDLMADQLTQTGYVQEWSDFLNDFVTYPAAHFKGPIYRKKTALKWETVQGEWAAVPTEEIVPTFQRVDPLRAYPAPGATTPQDSYWIEHISLSRTELQDLIGVEGYNEEAILTVLEEHKGGSLVNWLGLTDANQADAERGDVSYLSPDQDVEALEYYGPISGEDLLDWGLSKEDVPNSKLDYEVTAWLIGRHVIKAQINPSPIGLRPIYKACWEEIPGEYWGQGLPDGLRDIEGVTNSALRALVNNMSIASGPQVEVNIDRLPAGEDIETQHPWKIWQTVDSEYGSTGDAIKFFQPDMNAAALISVLDKFYQYADDWSLIPRYMGGSDSISGGIGRTASGMSMLFNAANKGLKGVVSTIDTRIVTPMLAALYTYNMMFEDDNSVKGDAQVEARGAIALMQIETLQLRRNEFLQATANPIDAEIVGKEGRREILREVAKGLEMDVNRIVPKADAQPQPQPAPVGQGPDGQSAISQPNQDQLFTGQPPTANFSNNNMRSAQ